MLKLTIAIALTAATLAPGPIHAEPARSCAERAQVLERLDTGYGESRQSIGLAGNGTVIEMFASTETGSWSILATSPDGRTCILAAGQSFENTIRDLTPVKGELI